MKKVGYLRAVVHIYKDDDGKLDIEFFEQDMFEYGHQATSPNQCPGWLSECIDIQYDSEAFVDMLKDLPNDDHVYEIVGDLYYECSQDYFGEWDSAWELRDESIKPVHDKWVEEYQKAQDESNADWKNRKRDPMVLYEACQFYAEAFNKKLSGGGMGQFTPFLVDRGARAKNAMSRYDYGMTLEESKNELSEES